MKFKSVAGALALGGGALLSGSAGATTVYHVFDAAGVAHDNAQAAYTLDQFVDANAFSSKSYIEIDSVRLQFSDVYALTRDIRVQAIDVAGQSGFGLQFDARDGAVGPWQVRPVPVNQGSNYQWIGFDISGINISLDRYTFLAGFSEQVSGPYFSSASVGLSLFASGWTQLGNKDTITCNEVRPVSPSGMCNGAALHQVNLSPDVLLPVHVEMDFSGAISTNDANDYVGARLAWVRFDPTAVPLPSSLALLGLGFGLMPWMRRSRPRGGV